MTLIRCTFCDIGGELYAKNHKMRDGGIQDIFQCKKCKSFYPQKRKSFKEIPDYLSIQNTNKDEFHSSDKQTEINKNNYLIRFLQGNIKVKGTALDVGAYIGGFVYNLKSMGLTAYGIEPQNNAVLYAQKEGLSVFAGMFPDDIPGIIPKNGYTLISFLESIYYTTNLKETFKKASEMLSEDGYLIIQSICGSSSYYDDKGISYFERYNDYVQVIPTYESIQYWLIQSGFEIKYMKELPILSINKHFKYDGKYLKVFHIYFGVFLDFFQKLFFGNMASADKLIIIAKKSINVD